MSVHLGWSVKERSNKGHGFKRLTGNERLLYCTVGLEAYIIIATTLVVPLKKAKSLYCGGITPRMRVVS